jgi:hypothetical protein
MLFFSEKEGLMMIPCLIRPVIITLLEPCLSCSHSSKYLLSSHILSQFVSTLLQFIIVTLFVFYDRSTEDNQDGARSCERSNDQKLTLKRKERKNTGTMSSSSGYVTIPRYPMIFHGTNYAEFAAFICIHMRAIHLWGVLFGEISCLSCPVSPVDRTPPMLPVLHKCFSGQ